MKVSTGVTHLEVNNIGLIGNGWSKMVCGTSIIGNLCVYTNHSPDDSAFR